MTNQKITIDTIKSALDSSMWPDDWSLTREQIDIAEYIIATVRGYSGLGHALFFKSLFRLPIKSLLMLGVYHGRDICLLDQFVPKGTVIVGVDRFTNEPCADWDEAERAKDDWVQAGYGNPPDLNRSWSNIIEHVKNGVFRLIKGDDSKALEFGDRTFDCIYLDTSHDKATVERQIKQAKPRLNPGGIICGDDYKGKPTWGVKEAVEAGLEWHFVFGGNIWLSNREAIKGE